MMTSNPLDHDTSDSEPAGIRLAEAARETDNAAWLDDLTIELRLLDVPGTAIGDAVASAREFLADSGARAEESFGSPARYAVELDLPTLPEDKSSNREVLLTSGIGVIGLGVLGQTAYPLAGGDDGLAVRLWMVVSLGATILLLGLIPRVIPVLLRARTRPRTVGLIAAGISFCGFCPVLLSVWWGQVVLFSVPALPVAIGAGILLLAPAIWNQLRQNLQDDPIIEPGTNAAPVLSRGVRLLVVGVNWIMVVYGAISFVLTFALYPNN
ncbi:hypothetical protein E3T39_03885 [Cryobacterium suzukii]|uniref:Uncharacterized protein n=1 Tax=Cryobacterium suzukii TaxID=1259198 RepID=A0A4R9AJ62_9MICO|nr:hypothetical protein [Cryobacterium suzukii]TFD62149.1 hypothetical protein E3T39_03885 [Cryobacterium suzukii]